MNKIWAVLPPPPQSFYESHPELPKIVATLLYNRKIQTQVKIDEFLHPDYSQDVHDPFLFHDMERTVDRLMKALEHKEKIIIYGDYDADGVSGSVILTELFRVLEHAEFDIYLPSREKDGYGLNKKAIEKFKEQGAKIIITCDCGISNTEEVAFANELNLDVIITDHHSIPETLPEAYAIIHPKIEGEAYPDKNLAGGAVAFKLVQAILKRHAKKNELLPNGESHEAFEKWQLGMVALSSVADMVPLIGESRTLTKYGLIVLNKTRRVGLKKLLLEARLMDADGTMKREIDANTIGFRIAPRINAAGRLNHANVAYKLMLTNDPIEATDLAYELDQNNTERQRLTDQYVGEANEQVQSRQPSSPFLFVFHKEWSPGILGLVASRIKEKYHKPTMAMTMKEDELIGSGRSVAGFNMIQAMQETHECFAKFGGHPMACGFTLTNPNGLEEFQKKMTKKFEERTADLNLTATLNIDAEVELEHVTWELYDILAKFEPFGQANPKPTYLARGLTVCGLEPVGKNKTHLRIMVSHKTSKIRKTIGWKLCNNNGTNWCNELTRGDTIDMVFEIGVNEWNGNRELQLTIVDLKKTDPAKPV